MRTITLTLPWPPSVNKIWRAVAGRIVLSAAARQYAIRAANALPTGHVAPLRGRLKVRMELFPPAGVNSKWDIGNREKCVCDVLTKQRVWLDDSQIDDLHIIRKDAVKDGQLIMTIVEISEC